MSRITTGTGLMSGLDIDDIVTKLMDISKRPLQALQTRVDNTTAKKTSFVELTALLLKVKMDTQAMFDTGNIFSYRSVSSSNESVLTATAGKSAPLGNYSFTVKSLVQAHQMMSGGYSGADSTIGAGTISIESGNGNVDRTTSLEDLNAGAGVAGGSIEITDRSGRSALVDLSGATTVADVLGAINGTTGLGVRASVSGDHLVLTDTTGATASNIIVEEVSGGSTAADIGLLGNSASATLAGNDIVALGRSTLLDSLNDGRGVRSIGGVTDFTITRKAGTSLDVQVSGNETVGDLLDSINNNAANADGRLVASLSGDGKGITLTDSTGGVGNLTVAAQNGSLAAADLGLIGDTPGAAVTGRRLIAGLNTVLLGSLNGGAGVAAGSILITNRAGASATVDLSAAGTLTDVIAAINASGVNVTASYNSSRTGLMLTDSSAGLGAFSVAEAGSTTAADLKIAGSAMGNTIRGANLQMQYINERTTLASLNNGDGVYKGSFRITDRAGGSALVDLSQDTDTRIEDVLAEINSRGIGVRASINATGDGILLTDTSGGLGDLKVENVDGMTATDLRIAGTASSTDPTHIDGSYEMHVTILATDTLQTIATKMSGSGAPITAKVISDGSRVSPYHISLISEQAGTSGNMVIDTGGLNLDFRTTQEGRDAVVLYGQQMSGSQGMLIRSSTNTISGIIDGVTLSLKGVSDSPVSIAVTSDDDSIVSEVSELRGRLERDDRQDTEPDGVRPRHAEGWGAAGRPGPHAHRGPTQRDDRLQRAGDGRQIQPPQPHRGLLHGDGEAEL